jgi:hypothetical protein
MSHSNTADRILLTDDGMEWTTQPVDAALVNAVNRALWPSPLAVTTWAFAGVLLKQHAQDLLRAIGYNSKNPSDLHTPNLPQGTPTAPGSPSTLPSQHHPDIQRALQRLQQQATKRPEDVKDPRAMASHGTDDAAFGASGSSTPAGTARPPSATTTNKSNQDRKSSTDLFPAQSSSPPAALTPWEAFKAILSQNLKRTPEQPPRGSVLVSGLVELEAPKGYTVIDVVAYWDPKTRQFDNKSMMVRLRRLQAKNQAPVGR